MAQKRLLWKTINLRSYDDYRAIQSAWGSSKGAFGKGKVVNFDGRSAIETNIPIAGLRVLFRHAGVTINWKNDILWSEAPAGDEADAAVGR